MKPIPLTFSSCQNLLTAFGVRLMRLKLGFNDGD